MIMDTRSVNASQTTHRSIAGLELRIDIRGGNRNGAAGRPPLMLCSGLGAGLEMFDPLIEALDHDIDIIRWDAPGIGGTPTSPLPLGFPLLARALAAALDELGYPQVDLLGYSWGGALAQQFALQYPSRCRRLILVSTNTGVLSVPGDLRVLSSMLIPPGLPVPGAAAAQEEVFAGADPDRRNDLRTLLRISRASSTSIGYLHQLAAVGTWTSLPFLPWLRQPVLVLSGADDPIVPIANAHLLAGAIPNAQLEIMPGGHSEIITGAAQVAPRVARFLR